MALSLRACLVLLLFGLVGCGSDNSQYSHEEHIFKQILLSEHGFVIGVQGNDGLIHKQKYNDCEETYILFDVDEIKPMYYEGMINDKGYYKRIVYHVHKKEKRYIGYKWFTNYYPIYAID